MSISSEITRISDNVSSALDAVESKGVTIPTGANSDDLPSLISSIRTGSSVVVTPTLLTGTDIASISVDGSSTTLYAPTPPTPSSATPQDLGTASSGSSTDYSRADHVHKLPTRTDLGLGSVALEDTVPISKGGTDGTSANQANNNLQNYNLLDGIIVGTNGNLNSLTTPNVYRSNGDAMTASLTGRPADLTHGFKMVVMAILSTSYIMQHIHEWDTGNEWKRYGSVSNDVWTFGSWVKVAVASPLAESNFTAIEDSFTVSFSAGTIGTRAQQFMLGRTIPSGMKLMSAVVTAIDASDKYLPVAFAHSNNLYLNIYRATDQAVSDKSVSVRYVLTDIF